MKKKIAIGSDHAGFDIKKIIIEKLNLLGHDVKDFGTNNTESVDYPDYAHPVSSSVEKKRL